MSTRPSRRQRPWTDSIVTPGDARRTRAAELQRVPGRAEAAEPGARPLADPAGAPASSVARHAAEAGPDPDQRTVPFRQQAWRAAARAESRGESVHSRRPGRALASRLPAPPVSTGTALPDQIVPRASASSRRWSVARGHGAAPARRPARTATSRRARRRARRRRPSARRRRAPCPRPARRASTRSSRWRRRSADQSGGCACCRIMSCPPWRSRSMPL